MRGRKTKGINDILEIWQGNDKKEIRYTDLKDEIVKIRNISERQAFRYIEVLRKQQKLEAIKNGPKNVLYKPNPSYWTEYQLSKQRQKDLGEFVAISLSKSIAEAKKLSKKMESEFWSEVSLNIEERGIDSSDAFDKAMDNVLAGNISKEELKGFYFHFDKLIKDCLISLNDEAVLSRLVIDDELSEILDEKISDLLNNYLAFWDFLYKHPYSSSELKKILSDVGYLQLRARNIFHQSEKVLHKE